MSLNTLALGDVVIDAYHPQRRALVIAQHQRSGPEVAYLTAGPDNPEFGVVGLLAAQGLGGSRVATRHVIGVKTRAPCSISAAEIFFAHAIQRVHPHVPVQLVFGDRPIPDPDLCRIRGQRQTPVERTDFCAKQGSCCFGVLALGDVGAVAAVAAKAAVGVKLWHT